MALEGRIRNMNIMEELRSLERNFSEDYKAPFTDLSIALSDMVWYIRNQSIPGDKKKARRK